MRPLLRRSEMTGRIYLITRYRTTKNGIEATQKYDVTEEYESLTVLSDPQPDSQPPIPTCTCLPLNRRLMAHLLGVTEGSVHEQGCWERAAGIVASPEQPNPDPLTVIGREP